MVSVWKGKREVGESLYRGEEVRKEEDIEYLFNEGECDDFDFHKSF